MELIRQNRLIASILGGLVVISLLVLIFNGDSSSSNIPASDLPTQTPAAAGTVAPEVVEFPHPDIEQLPCGPLLTLDDIDAALGSTAWLTIGGGESCTHRLVDDSAVFVRIQPGQPADLIDGGLLDGVSGQAIAEVGDAAAWFGSASTLSVAAEGQFGVLVFRITVIVPDLDEAARLEAAKALALAALPRFPGIEVEAPPPPELVLITIEHEPVDRSGQSFVENLLAREADGEWTQGEGLVATLRYFAGELDAAEVLRHSEVLDGSGTSIVRLAQAYVETGADENAVAEIERILDLLLVRDRREGSADSEASAPGARVRPIAYRTSQEIECVFPYPDHGDPCFYSAQAAEQFGDQYLFWYPEADQWEGWVRGPSTVRDAMRESAVQLESMSGSMPHVVEVWLAPFAGNSWVVLDRDAGLCWIQLNKGAQTLRDRDTKLLKQAVAATMARCYIEWNFGSAEEWESPISWYLSDVIVPGASMETLILKIPDALAGEELGSTLLERSLTNMTFFEYIDAARGLEGTISAVGTIYGSGLSDVSGIDDLLHEYAKALTDGVIIDQGGAHSYGPPSKFSPLARGVTISTSPQPFGLERIRVSVEGGTYACLEYPDAGNLDIVVSWREGAPGESGSWTTQLPTSVQGQGVFLLTTTEPGGKFSIKVRDVDDDDPNCEEEEEESSGDPGPPCGFCNPTDFWHVWENWTHMVIGG